MSGPPLPNDPSAAPPARRVLGPFALGLAAALIVLAVNAPALGFGWLMFDDDINVLVNPHLGSGLTSIEWACGNIDYIRRYLPLGWIGFEVLLGVDGYNAAVFHAAGWLLGGLNALLVACVFARLLAGSTRAWSAGVPVLAALAAVAWSVHPLRAETAGWISGLLYLGATAFAAGAVLVHLRGDELSAGDARGAGWRVRTVAAALYLASLLVYPVFLSLPLVLLWRAACLTPRRERGRAVARCARTLTGWWLAAALVAAINLFARVTAAGHFEGAAAASPGHFLQMPATALRAVWHYLAITVWPIDTAIYYGAPDAWVPRGAAIVFALAAGALAVLAVKHASLRRQILGWGGAGLLALLPALLITDASFQPNDRYAVLWLAVWTLAGATLVARLRRPGRAVAVGAVVVALLVVPYRAALARWRDTTTVQAMIDRATVGQPDAKMSFGRPATVAWLLGDRAEMARRVQAGRERLPHSPHLAQAEARIAELDAAWYRRVGAAAPQIPPLAVQHFDLGRGWLARGKPRAAAAHFARALELAPGFGDARRALAGARASVTPPP